MILNNLIDVYIDGIDGTPSVRQNPKDFDLSPSSSGVKSRVFLGTEDGFYLWFRIHVQQFFSNVKIPVFYSYVNG